MTLKSKVSQHGETGEQKHCACRAVPEEHSVHANLNLEQTIIDVSQKDTSTVPQCSLVRQSTKMGQIFIWYFFKKGNAHISSSIDY